MHLTVSLAPVQWFTTSLTDIYLTRAKQHIGRILTRREGLRPESPILLASSGSPFDFVVFAVAVVRTQVARAYPSYPCPLISAAQLVLHLSTIFLYIFLILFILYYIILYYIIYIYICTVYVWVSSKMDGDSLIIYVCSFPNRSFYQRSSSSSSLFSHLSLPLSLSSSFSLYPSLTPPAQTTARTIALKKGDQKRAL